MYSEHRTLAAHLAEYGILRQCAVNKERWSWCLYGISSSIASWRDLYDLTEEKHHKTNGPGKEGERWKYSLLQKRNTTDAVALGRAHTSNWRRRNLFWSAPYFTLWNMLKPTVTLGARSQKVHRNPEGRKNIQVTYLLCKLNGQATTKQRSVLGPSSLRRQHTPHHRLCYWPLWQDFVARLYSCQARCES